MNKQERNQAESLHDLTKMLLMEQIIISPTSHNNLLHLCVTNNLEIIHNVNMSPTIFPDHNMIEMSIYGTELTKDEHRTEYTQTLSSLNFYKVNWKSIEKQLLLQNWTKTTCFASNRLESDANN